MCAPSPVRGTAEPRRLVSITQHTGMTETSARDVAAIVRDTVRARVPDASYGRALPDDTAVGRAGLGLDSIAIKDQGVVMAAIDGPGGASSTTVPCLGRRIVVRRGPLAVARLTGAPLVPVVAQWMAHGRIRILTGSPFSLPAANDPLFERAAALAVARWLELHLTTYPDDLWPYTLRNLIASPMSQASSP
jgi:hypothetical protein